MVLSQYVFCLHCGTFWGELKVKRGDVMKERERERVKERRCHEQDIIIICLLLLDELLNNYAQIGCLDCCFCM